MPYFLKSGKCFKVSAKESLDLHERLPVGNYTIKFDSCSGNFYFEEIDSFQIKGKLYGNTTRHAARILQTFEDRDAATGVLLAGLKGSGKTLLAKYIAIEAAEKYIPTVIINQDWCGEQFNTFMQSIEQPLIVLFDEFEKVYARGEKQEQMLTLLDGVYPSKKLFLFTCNDKWKVNSNMRNRPGRIFYALDFEGLDQIFIREYCEDNLVAKEHIPKVCAISGVFPNFNFDVLKAMVEEMNRYNETPSEVLKFLNARPEFEPVIRYAVKLSVNGVAIKQEHGGQNEWSGNPLKDQIQVHYTDESARRGKCERFTARDLEHLDTSTRTYVFVNKAGSRLHLCPISQGYKVDFDSFVPSSTGITKFNAVETTDISGMEMDTNVGDY